MSIQISRTQRRTFDPRIQFNSAEDENAAKLEWSSKSVKLAYEAIDKGLPLKASPFFKGNINVRRGGLLYRYEPWEWQEWLKCKLDILYFADNYCKLLTPDGVQKRIKLRKYQRKMLRIYAAKKYVIVLTGRQIGKTTTTAIFLAWCAIFHKEMNIAVLGDRRDTSMENLNKTKAIIASLPFFLKPGAFVWNSSSVCFDNGCRIITATCSKSALVGKTMHVVYADELAIPPAKQSKELVDYVLPTINTIKTGKFIASSTPSGDNIFKDLWLGAINGTNGFYPIQVNWWEVPGRDDAWKAEQLSILGDDAFNEQYNCVFLTGTKSVIASFAIDAMARRLREYVYRPHDVLDNIMQYLLVDPDIKNAECEPNLFMTWHKDIDIANLRNEVIVLNIDIAEGLGGDYSVITVHRLLKIQQMQELDEVYDEYADFNADERSAFREAVEFAHRAVVEDRLRYDAYVKQLQDINDDDDIEGIFDVDYGSTSDWSENDMALNATTEMIGLFHSNQTSIKALALYVQFLMHELFDINKTKIVFERNKYGAEFKSYLLHERVNGVIIDDESLAKFPATIGNDARLETGITLTPGTKPMYVKMYKEKIESGHININNIHAQREIQYFGKHKNGSYSATDGFHDDIAITIVELAAFMDDRNTDWLFLLEALYSKEHSMTAYDGEIDVEDANDSYSDVLI